MKIKTGTKSVLWGVHAFWWHPLMVAMAWVKLFGWPWDPRVWMAFFVHDLGYWGCPNMDGPEGKKHPEVGARIMHVFDGYRTEYCKVTNPSKQQFSDLLDAGGRYVIGWRAGNSDVVYKLKRKIRSTKWQDFSLYHSRSVAKEAGRLVSKLCMADKLAVCFDPYWFYMLRATLSGEITEYLENHQMESKFDWYYIYRADVVCWVKQEIEYRKSKGISGKW